MAPKNMPNNSFCLAKKYFQSAQIKRVAGLDIFLISPDQKMKRFVVPISVVPFKGLKITSIKVPRPSQHFLVLPRVLSLAFQQEHLTEAKAYYKLA